MKTDWYKKLQPLTCNDGFNLFHKHPTDSLDKHAPEKEYASTKVRKHQPWFTLKKSSTKLKQLYKRLLIKKDDTSKKTHKEFRTLYNKVKRVSMIMYYHTEITSHIDNSRRLWQIINKLSGKQTNKSFVIECLTIDQIKLCEAKLITEEFAKHFASVGKRYSTKIDWPNHSINHYLSKIESTNRSIYLYPSTQREIELLIKKLPNKTSSGHDKISNKLLKDLSGILVPLELLFNKSLTEGTFPNAMKLADVVPLHKGKKADFINNYRPISLLLTISKLIEKIMYKRTYDFLNNNNLIFSSQYGF